MGQNPFTLASALCRLEQSETRKFLKRLWRNGAAFVVGRGWGGINR